MDYVASSDYVGTPVNWAYSAPFEPNRGEPREYQSARKIRTIVNGATDFFETPKGAQAPTSFPAVRQKNIAFQDHTNTVVERSSPSAGSVPSPAKVEDVDRIANQRVKLLAVKYAGNKESVELVARLEILNRRLLDQSPRISAQQVASLEESSLQLARAASSRENRMRRLGIEG
jgi:hypothetical protein